MKNKTTSIKTRAIVLVIAIFIASSAAVALVTSRSQINSFDESISDKIKNDVNLISSQVEAEAEGLCRPLGFMHADAMLPYSAIENNPEQ